jgi:hypothetical protein
MSSLIETRWQKHSSGERKCSTSDRHEVNRPRAKQEVPQRAQRVRHVGILPVRLNEPLGCPAIRQQFRGLVRSFPKRAVAAAELDMEFAMVEGGALSRASLRRSAAAGNGTVHRPIARRGYAVAERGGACGPPSLAAVGGIVHLSGRFGRVLFGTPAKLRSNQSSSIRGAADAGRVRAARRWEIPHAATSLRTE